MKLTFTKSHDDGKGRRKVEMLDGGQETTCEYSAEEGLIIKHFCLLQTNLATRLIRFKLATIEIEK